MGVAIVTIWRKCIDRFDAFTQWTVFIDPIIFNALSMQSHMHCTIKHFKVLYAIVSLDAIFMMDAFTGLQLTAKMRLHYQAVF